MSAGAPFLNAALGGRSNSAAQWHAYLEAFHDEQPDANEIFTLLRTPQGLTSYEMVARTARATGKNVLDVGCGDGNLADAFHDSGVQYTGIDIAEHQIAIARNRYARETSMHFECGDVRALPYDDERFDTVVSHQFLNLISDPEPVLREIARVLQPRGRLLVVANRGWTSDRENSWIYLDQAARAAVVAAYPDFVWPSMGDRRIHSERGIVELFGSCEAFDIETLTVGEFTPGAFMTPEQLAAMYNRLYVYGSIPNRAPILEAVASRARELADGRNLVEIDLPFRLINIAKRA
ncbi:MAG TPA: methyltransferase domain-containing protein [Candidatus Baltobacteraceae bacterium]|nr:methyltransferase domain-containing protein [Candidatus Baltobacteraceae bacterium]